MESDQIRRNTWVKGSAQPFLEEQCGNSGEQDPETYQHHRIGPEHIHTDSREE